MTTLCRQAEHIQLVIQRTMLPWHVHHAAHHNEHGKQTVLLHKISHHVLGGP